MINEVHGNRVLTTICQWNDSQQVLTDKELSDLTLGIFGSLSYWVEVQFF